MKLKNNKNICIWFTGLSASGKSTLSELLYSDIKKNGISNIILLDGEAVREQLKYEGYDTNDRNEIGFKKSKFWGLGFENKIFYLIFAKFSKIDQKIGKTK